MRCHANRLKDLLADDLIQTIMTADHVDPVWLEILMLSVARQRERKGLARQRGFGNRITRSLLFHHDAPGRRHFRPPLSSAVGKSLYSRIDLTNRTAPS